MSYHVSAFRSKIRKLILLKKELNQMEACEPVVFDLLLKRQKLILGMPHNVTTHPWSKTKIMKINFTWATWAHLKPTWIILRDLLKPCKLAQVENKKNYKISLKTILWIRSNFKTTILIIPKKVLKTAVTTNSFKLNKKFLIHIVNCNLIKVLE